MTGFVGGMKQTETQDKHIQLAQFINISCASDKTIRQQNGLRYCKLLHKSTLHVTLMNIYEKLI